MSLKDVDWRAKVRPLFKAGTRLPPVVRSLCGVALLAAGILGVVMPLLGFWMAPMGAMLIALDVPPWRRRVEAWLEEEPARG